ncbi:hypothetical protein DI487_15930 [Flavobacterium sediminis]|uniref:Uncharacterized protein n=1 Tax=Flavobacterium sediminis TaxID=2201181 RepID=A0A2U8QYA2_9FLAO|nr:hypothetical protein [Flavobacterium sediminis]AWM15200.1 hypothetical protein DI487_15930 [Flavobacterium sediminis]
MVKAHSLLYAVYVCLLVGLLIGGLLILSNLYNQLNLFYETREGLYINNQSTINFALGNQLAADEEILTEEGTGIRSAFRTKKHGLQTVLLTESFLQNDTIQSAHLIGQKLQDNIALYVANFTQSLSVSGKVTVKGNLFLPNERLKETYIENKPNIISVQGRKNISEVQLPKLSEDCKKIFEDRNTVKVSFNQLEAQNDSLYFNSFFNETIEIQIANSYLDDKIIKGNFILSSHDSIVIRNTNTLEDVIVMAPKVSIEEGFKGNIQVLAKEKIYVGKKAELTYPSVLCLYNETDKKATVFIDEETKISGLVLAFGNDVLHLENNWIETSDFDTITGTVYSTGKLTLKGQLFGSAYASRMVHTTKTSNYSNCMADVAIDLTHKPKVFIDLPIFDNQKQHYGILKKVL